MRYTLTDDQEDLRASLRTFLSNSVTTAMYEAACGRADGFDQAAWEKLAANGWLDLHAMAAMDGSTWPIAGTYMAEEFGRQLVPAPVELVAGFLLPVLHQLPGEPFGISLDEDPFVGKVPAVDLRSLLTSVYGDRGARASKQVTVAETSTGLTLSGTLDAVQFASSAGSLFLPVQLRSGWALARVDLTAPDVSVEIVKTIDLGRTSATVTLAAASIPADQVVTAGLDGASMQDILEEGLLSYLLFLDGKAVGASQLLLERTIAYVSDRHQFGVPIGSFQAVKHAVAQMATGVESARSLVSYTAWQVSQRKDDRVEAALSSRLYAADVYRRVCELAIQCHGGMGFTWEMGLHFWYQSAIYDAAVTDLTVADLGRVLRSIA